MSNTIYLATVMDQYAHPAYFEVQKAVMTKFRCKEGVKLIEPACIGWDLAGWRKAWNRLLPTLDGLVAWPRPNFTIGKGVFREIWDCRRAQLPVWIITDELDFYTDFDLSLLDGDSYRYFAEVRLAQEVGDGE